MQNKMLPYKDVNIEILNLLDDKSLGRMCQVNPSAKKICDDDNFWKNRIINIFGKELLKEKYPFETFKEFYQSNRFADFKKKNDMCRDLLKIPKLSQMVIDDFYNPDKGFVDIGYTMDREGITYLLLKIVLERSENKEEIEKLITEIKERIPEYRLALFDTETFNLTDKEKKLFRQIIDVPFLNRIELLKTTAKNMPDVIRSLGLNEAPLIFKFVVFIHNGFKTGRLPLNIKWDELCTHPYLFQK